jgi:hypothetical protein
LRGLWDAEAAEISARVRKGFPQRLKPDSSARVTAQLKLCPFKTESFPHWIILIAEPGKHLPSAAEAGLVGARYGTAEAVPLQSRIFSALDYFDSGARKAPSLSG